MTPDDFLKVNIAPLSKQEQRKKNNRNFLWAAIGTLLPSSLILAFTNKKAFLNLLNYIWNQIVKLLQNFQETIFAIKPLDLSTVVTLALIIGLTRLSENKEEIAISSTGLFFKWIKLDDINTTQSIRFKELFEYLDTHNTPDVQDRIKKYVNKEVEKSETMNKFATPTIASLSILSMVTILSAVVSTKIGIIIGIIEACIVMLSIINITRLMQYNKENSALWYITRRYYQQSEIIVLAIITVMTSIQLATTASNAIYALTFAIPIMIITWLGFVLVRLANE